MRVTRVNFAAEERMRRSSIRCREGLRSTVLMVQCTGADSFGFCRRGSRLEDASGRVEGSRGLCASKSFMPTLITHYGNSLSGESGNDAAVAGGFSVYFQRLRVRAAGTLSKPWLPKVKNAGDGTALYDFHSGQRSPQWIRISAPSDCSIFTAC